MVSSTTTTLATRVDNDLARAFEEAAAELEVTPAEMIERALIYYKQKNPKALEALDKPDPLESLETFSKDLTQ